MRGSAAAGVVSGIGDRAQPIVGIQHQRDADQVAAGGASSRAGERARGGVTAPGWVLQMGGERIACSSPVRV